jgi:hypothetical protein
MDARRGPLDEFVIATAVLTRLPVGAGAADLRFANATALSRLRNRA